MMAVRGVSLSISKGSVVGVVGESGCGKSTLARLVLRLIEPTSGTVTYDGTDLTALKPGPMRAMRRRMQMVFQDPYSSLDPRYTVADVLTEPYVVQGVKLPTGRVAELLAQVGLSAATAQSYPHQLSGGQRQRVGIARALALAPEFLVLDEPTASLDVSIQAQIISSANAARRSGPDLSVHQPRPWAGALFLRPDRGDVSGIGGRGYARPTGQPAPPLYGGADGQHLCPRPGQTQGHRPDVG